MKLVTRERLLSEYNSKYTVAVLDTEERLKRYFKDNNLDFDKAKSKARKKLLSILKHREYKTIRLTLLEFPMKTDRPRHTKFGTVYSPNAKANNDYLKKALKAIKQEFKLINTPAKIQIDAYIEMPNGVKPDEVILFELKVLDIEDYPDYDNIAKCYTDMQLKNLILDDDLYHKAVINKYYSLLPRVEITITYLGAHESEYIFKKLKKRKSVKDALKSNLIVLEKIEEG